MTDATAARPASFDDLEKLGAEIAGRANALHDELRNELQESQQAVISAVQAEADHNIRIQRSELRLLHQQSARQSHALAETVEVALSQRADRAALAALAVLTASALAVVLLVVAVAMLALS